MRMDVNFWPQHCGNTPLKLVNYVPLQSVCSPIQRDINLSESILVECFTCPFHLYSFGNPRGLVPLYSYRFHWGMHIQDIKERGWIQIPSACHPHH